VLPESDVVPVTPDMMASETLGNYDLLRRLGAGGMAEVHLARQHALEGFQKLVVLKQVLPHLARDRHFVRMFLEEARLAALLDHPNVVQVFDLGHEGGEFFFTMEFVYGENLQSVVRAMRRAGHAMPFELAVAIAMGVASGLHYAHERVGFDGRPLGIVHRDVSPTNVMITYEGCVKVADFGIAKVVTRTDVTQAGIRKGKVPYMSPEQCRAQPIDRRSDIFSLGVVLWETSTGERLFDGDNEFGVMNRIVNGDIPLPSAVRPGYPKDLERIVMRALSVDREKRFGSAHQLMLELEALARDKKWRATSSALGELMHQLFRPKPFPWGALMGDGVSGQPALTTVSEASLKSSSVASAQHLPSRPDMTPTSHVGSYHSTISPAQQARARTLRGLAIGLGSVAAVAVLSVAGFFVYKQGAGSAAAAAAAAAEAEREGSTPRAPAAEDAPAASPTPAAAAAAALPVGGASEPAEGKAAAPPAEDAPAEDAPAEDAPAEDARAEDAPQEAAEDEPAIIEDAAPAPTKAKPKTKPSGKSTKGSSKVKGKPNLDAFLPG
jgi:serine/threonine protein kinase